jgi:hypothetical protein
MKMTELQFAGITINLSALGQVDLSDNDPELLIQLAQLLERARANVEKAIDVQQEAQAARYEREHGEPPF